MANNMVMARGIGMGFMIGAAVGAAIGVLYAPHSGRITRGLIDERMHEATHRAEKIVDDARERAENIVKEASERVGA
jgi:gas vesicle protein